MEKTSNIIKKVTICILGMMDQTSCSIIDLILMSQLFIYFVENLKYIKKKAVTGIVLIAEPPRITFCHARGVQMLNFAHQHACIKPYRDTIDMNAL